MVNEIHKICIKSNSNKLETGNRFSSSQQGESSIVVDQLLGKFGHRMVCEMAARTSYALFVVEQHPSKLFVRVGRCVFFM